MCVGRGATYQAGDGFDLQGRGHLLVGGDQQEGGREGPQGKQRTGCGSLWRGHSKACLQVEGHERDELAHTHQRHLAQQHQPEDGVPRHAFQSHRDGLCCCRTSTGALRSTSSSSSSSSSTASRY